MTNLALLEDIAEYLEQRADADGIPSGGGYRPNEEMRLLVKVQEAIRHLQRCDATSESG